MLVDIFLQAEAGAPADVYLRSGPSIVIVGNLVAGESPDALASDADSVPPRTGTPVYGVNTFYEFKGPLPLNPIVREPPQITKRPARDKITEQAEPPKRRLPIKQPDRDKPEPEDNDDEEVLAIVEAWLKVQGET